MSEGVLIALITSVGTFLGVIISNFSSNKNKRIPKGVFCI